MNRKPTVLVTGPEKRLRFGWWALRYMLRNYNLELVYGTPETGVPERGYSGVIISGGDDIEPENYGLMKSGKPRRYNPKRDHFELSVLDKVLTSDMPLIGICRGAQLLNVALGGSLLQDITELRQLTPNKRSIRRIKSVTLDSSSKMRRVFDRQALCVNSLHEQAGDELGEGLEAVAADRDHFVQGIEAPERNFTLGVQWHPEYLPYDSAQKRLMREFARKVHRYDEQVALASPQLA